MNVRETDKADSKEALLVASAEVFARHGYDGATVKMLAEAAGVNVSLVSYYFDGKEGLYSAVLESFGRSHLAAAERVLKAATTAEEFRLRLGLFLEEFMAQHLSHPHVCTIIHRDCVGDNPLTEGVFRNVFIKIFETLLGFFVAAQKKGVLRKDMDALFSAGFLFGGIIHMLRMQHKVGRQFGINLADPKIRERIINEAVRNLAEGVIAKGGSS